MEVLVAFGRAIKGRRSEVGITQEELAHRAEIARSYLSAIERGINQAGTNTVWRIARSLNCKPSDLWIRAEALIDS